MLIRSKFIFVIIYFLLLNNKFCKGDFFRNFTPANSGFGPYFLSTSSIEKCESATDTKHQFVAQVIVRKTSRTSEEVIGNCTVPNDVHVSQGMVEFQKWYDGGFRTEFKKYLNDPCGTIGFSFIMKKNLNPDKNCNVKKGVYKIDGLNPDAIMHLAFQYYHYNRYVLILEWLSEEGSLGCFKMMCEIKPLRKPKKGRKKS